MSAADGLHLNLPRAPDNTFDTRSPKGTQDAGMQSKLTASGPAQFGQEGEGLLQVLLPPLPQIPPIH